MTRFPIGFRSPWVRLGLFLALFSLLFTGCSYKNRQVLFKTPVEVDMGGKPFVRVNANKQDTSGYEHRIKADDRISVRFISNANFEKGMSTPGGMVGDEPMTFLVDKQGKVSLPMLGKVSLLGLTKQAASDSLARMYGQSFVNPSVEVTIMDLSVQVLGEVKTPGVYPLSRERTTLVEILSRAGGITAYGKKRFIKIIRGAGTGREPEQIIFDLTQIQAIQPELMILRDKDIVYVEPRNIAVVGEALAPYASLISLVSTIGTLSLIIYQTTRPTN